MNNELEGTAYDTCQFELNRIKIISRSSKITPKKVGQFDMKYSERKPTRCSFEKQTHLCKKRVLQRINIIVNFNTCFNQ